MIAASLPGWGGSLQLSPVRAVLTAARPVEAIKVKNHGTEPSVVQLEPMAWSQQGGKDVYTPTRDIIATPPIFTVQPGATQLVRVGLRRPADPARELSYRLYFQEVPPPPAPGFQGLQVALRLGVPIFVNGPSAPPRELKWSLRRGSGGELIVGVANAGAAHLQVAGFSLRSGDTPLAEEKNGVYVLPGQSREWIVKPSAAPRPGSAVTLIAQTDAGDIRVDLAAQ